MPTTFLFSQNKNYKNDLFYGGSIGYFNQNGNFGKIGGFVAIASDNKSVNIFKIDVNANITGMQHQFKIIPEVGLAYYILHDKLAYTGIFIETEITPYTFTPKAGISLFSILDLGIGYGTDLKTKNNYKTIDGLQISIGFNLPFNFNIY